MKMEIELTQDQADKVKLLEENGMSIGDAIDALFEMKEAVNSQTDTIIENKLEAVNKEKAELEARMNEIDEEISVFTKLKDASLDVGQKQKIIEKDYGELNETYDKVILDAKHKFKWSKKLFKF